MDTFEVHLSDPASTFQNGTLKIVIGKETNNADVIHFYVELRQGTTVIASWAYADVAYGLAMKTERLTDAQFAAITDFTDLRVRVTSGPGWTPTAWLSTSKLVAWYDFSNEASLTIASGTVSSAADLSGNGLPASQGTAASQAVYSRTGWPGGSKGAVIPDGFNDGYDFTPGLSYNSTTGFSSACILYNSASGNRTVFSHWGGTSAPCLKLVGDTVDLTRNFVAYLVQTPATCRVILASSGLMALVTQPAQTRRAPLRLSAYSMTTVSTFLAVDRLVRFCSAWRAGLQMREN
jgi:hypothetical protein